MSMEDVEQRKKYLIEIANLLSEDIKNFINENRNPTQISGKSKILTNFALSLSEIDKLIIEYERLTNETNNTTNTVNIENIWKFISEKNI